VIDRVADRIQAAAPSPVASAIRPRKHSLPLCLLSCCCSSCSKTGRRWPRGCAGCCRNTRVDGGSTRWAGAGTRWPGGARGTVLVAAIDAVGIGLALMVIGVPLALPLALLTFLGAFVPILGATSPGR
jgi:putative heme transporter